MSTKVYIENILRTMPNVGIRSNIDFFNNCMKSDPVEDMIKFINALNDIDFSIFDHSYNNFNELQIKIPNINKFNISNDVFLIASSIPVTASLGIGKNSTYSHKAIVNLKKKKITNISTVFSLLQPGSNGKGDEDILFYLIPGETKFLISGQWIDRMSLEENAFQYSTAEARVPYDLSDINRIVNELGDLT